MNETSITTEPQIAYSECYAQVFLGDCLDIMPQIESNSVDMILCDLPYGTRQCKWDSVIPFALLWEQYERIIKDNGAIVLFGSEPFSSALRMSNIQHYRYDWKWDKDQAGNFAMAKKQPLKTYEDIIVFSKKQCLYNPIMTKADPTKIRPIADGTKINTYITQKHSIDYDPKSRYPKAILSYSANNKECNKIHRLHPTQKPVELLEYLIKTYTDKNMIVMDNTMGSGSTGVACKNLNRNFIGIEKDEQYFKIAEQRINARTLFS